MILEISFFVLVVALLVFFVVRYMKTYSQLKNSAEDSGSLVFLSVLCFLSATIFGAGVALCLWQYDFLHFDQKTQLNIGILFMIFGTFLFVMFTRDPGKSAKEYYG